MIKRVKMLMRDEIEGVYGKAVSDKLNSYEEQLKEWRSRINIIGKNDNIWQRHIADSLWIVPHIKKHLKKGDKIIDIGTGAGLPGVVISIVLDRPVVLVDSREKKCFFLEEIRKKLGLDIEIICERIENLQDKYEIIVSRGLAPLVKLLDLSESILSQGGICFFMKGKRAEEEYKEAIEEFSGLFEKERSPIDREGYLLVISEIERR